MTTPALISILVPSYNQGRFLRQTLRSIVDQGDPSLEIIVCDGGSTDETLDVLKEFDSHLSYWVSERDRGQSHALNKALARATGEFVGWINSDDCYVQGAFRTVRAAFASHPEVGVVHGDRLLIDQDGLMMGWSCGSTFRPEQYGYDIASETAFWRRRVPEQLGLQFDESLQFAMDLDWFTRLYAAHVPFLHLDRFLGCFRCYELNKSSTMGDVCAEETARLWHARFHNDTWRIPPLRNRFRQSFAPFLHPMLIGFPYFVRRCVHGRRGMHPMSRPEVSDAAPHSPSSPV